jgi:hypothetical protein
MTYQWPEGEPIRMITGEDGRPRRFTRRDRHYAVQAIRRTWQVKTDWWEGGGMVWRQYFRIVTAEGIIFELYQDLLTEHWCIEKVYD